MMVGMHSQKWQYIGLGVLAVVTLAFVAYVLATGPDGSQSYDLGSILERLRG